MSSDNYEVYQSLMFCLPAISPPLYLNIPPHYCVSKQPQTFYESRALYFIIRWFTKAVFTIYVISSG